MNEDNKPNWNRQNKTKKEKKSAIQIRLKRRADIESDPF